MIDWLTLKVRCVHPVIASGRMISIDDDGVVVYDIAKSKHVRGSHNASVAVKSHGSFDSDRAEFLMISGNPSKFLQGHNVFGSDDLCALADGMVAKVLEILDRIWDEETQTWLQRGLYVYDDVTRHLVKNGQFFVGRIDINYSFELRNQADVLAFIHAAQFKARARAGRPTTYPGTIYFGQNSSRWTVKFYSKYREITSPGKNKKDHVLCDSLKEHHEKLIEWTKNILRIEVCLRSKELKTRNLQKGTFLQTKITELFEEYRSKIIMADQMPVQYEKLHELKQNLKSTYVLWKSGHRMIDIMPRSTYYKFRKELLAYNVDISIPCDLNAESNVTPLIRVLTAKPVSLPTWAYNDNLIYQPTVSRIH